MDTTGDESLIHRRGARTSLMMILLASRHAFVIIVPPMLFGGHFVCELFDVGILYMRIYVIITIYIFE
jgi:hypothetical protein